MPFQLGVLSALLSLMLLGVAQTPPAVALWRLDCGTIWVADLDEYSDTRAYVGQSRRFAVSCYLIQHDDTYMLWDAGLSKEALGKPLVEGSVEDVTLRASIVDQIAKLDVRPQQVGMIGISHYHFDHTGQAIDFPQAKLLIGKADLDALRSPGNADAKPLAHWVSGGGAIQEVEGDLDVFGDGSVVMLDLPGHTPGHHGLLVKLARTGFVLLSGDVAHVRENLATDGVPSFNVDRARSLASLDRFKQLAHNLKATVIIQHDERDISKLPDFPAAAN